jgi:formylglycine-generating enzyme required for sulfatase activity
MGSSALLSILALLSLLGCTPSTPAPSPASPQTARVESVPEETLAAQDAEQPETTPIVAEAADVHAEVPPEEVAPPEPPELIAPTGERIVDCEAAPQGMACVPGGPFIRGMDNDPHEHCDQPSYNKKDQVNTNPAETIWMQTYYMDLTEVSTEAFQACIKAKKCEKAGPKYNDFSRPLQPVTGISWFDAYNFCKAQGKHLPSEAEWEKAARGPDGELYPWGNEPAPSCENAVIMNEKKERSCGVQKKGAHPEKGRVLEVCSREPGRYGLCDMVGNAEEWVADWYSANYTACGEGCQGFHPLGPCGGGPDDCQGHRYKLVRGGSWYWPAEHATGIHRRSHVASNDPYHHFGFRCAASPDEAAALRPAEE